MAVLVFLTLFLSFTSYSSAQYCLCKPGSQSPDPYKKVIDFACGNGANCVPIQSNGPCYQANDVQAICSYAANSYYQNKKSQGATCDFGGVCSPAGSLPTNLPSGCTFPTSGGTASTGTGITTSTTPGGGGVSTGGVNTGQGNIFSPIGLGPTGSMTDPNDATSLLQMSSCIASLSLTLFSGIMILWA